MQEYTHNALSERALSNVYAEIRYEPYLKREEKETERVHYYKSLEFPSDFNYRDLPGLSKELQEKLIRLKPHNVAQASLIPGMTPAALSLLIFKVRKGSFAF